jgi:hypothetical protein
MMQPTTADLRPTTEATAPFTTGVTPAFPTGETVLAIVTTSPGEPENLIVRNPAVTAEAGLPVKDVEITTLTAHPTGEKDLIIPADPIITIAADLREIKAGTRVMATGLPETETERRGTETVLPVMETETHRMETELPVMETVHRGMETALPVMETETQAMETGLNRETITGNTAISQSSEAINQKLPIKNSANLKRHPKKLLSNANLMMPVKCA